MKWLVVFLLICVLAWANCEETGTQGVEYECTPKAACYSRAYVDAKYSGQYSFKGSSLICSTLKHCYKNGFYKYCQKGYKNDHGVKIEWCNCGTHQEPSGCHIQLRTNSWDGGQQYRCVGTCSNGKRCVTIQTKVKELTPNGSPRRADIYCGCAPVYQNYYRSIKESETSDITESQ